MFSIADTMERILKEINQFVQAIPRIEAQGYLVERIDEYGYVIRPDESCRGKRIDLLITGLIHGNEVLGVEVINRLVSRFAYDSSLKISLGFVLCNIEAAKKNVRYIETDLNRSFLVKEVKSIEQKRAAELAQIVDQADFVFDIHQTSEPSLNPFFIFKHDHATIQMVHQLLPQFPMVTFGGNGFSQNGKTMIEYAGTIGTKAIVIECGQNGFSDGLSFKLESACLGLIKNLNKNKIRPLEKIPVVYLVESIVHAGHTALVPGLTSYMPITQGQVLAYDNGLEIKAPFNGRLFFPCYGQYAQTKHELCNLGREINYLDV